MTALPPETDLFTRAVSAHAAGQRAEADRLCGQLLAVNPLHPGAIYLLGVMSLESEQFARAVQLLHHAALLEPANASYRHALGEAFRGCGKLDAAIEALRDSLRLEARNAAAENALGEVLLQQAKHEEARASFRRALALRPDYARAYNNLGRLAQAQKNLDEARRCFAEAVRIQPAYAIAQNNLGAALVSLGKPAEALPCLREALRLQPTYPEAFFNRGNALMALDDTKAAAADFREAVRLRPEYAKAHNHLGQAYVALGQAGEARSSFQTSLRLQPDEAGAWMNLGYLLANIKDWDGATLAFQRTLELQPDSKAAFALSALMRAQLCDWSSRDADLARLQADVEAQLRANEETAIGAFQALTTPWPPQLQLAIARSHATALTKRLEPTRRSFGFTYPRTKTGRLRIGYLSGDFHDHAVSHLIQGIFAFHDRREFEVFAYSFGPDDGSEYRQRIRRDAEHFVDLFTLSATESAKRIHADGIHILLDLAGYIHEARLPTVALRPAPIQALYLGFPGTMGGDYLDYLIGDPIVTPLEKAAGYAEKLVLLPHSFLVTDHEQPISAAPLQRRSQGLPENGCVFCCFNNSYKIEPVVFSVWMRLLNQVPGSVLWLSTRGATAERNLRREAQSRGVSPARLLFADHPPKSVHLARQRLADLFVDTLQYNAHTTACDALWAGLPVLTCAGENFPARVAASLLHAVGLPEMVMPNLDAYERRALELARQPDELRRLRDKLAANLPVCPLFDTPRFVRCLERAFRAMWERYAAGQALQALVIEER